MRRCALLASFFIVLAGCHNDKSPSVESLAKSLKEDGDRDIRYSAAKALGRYGPEAKEAVPALANALADSDDAVRIGAAYALAKIGPDATGAIPALQVALKDKHPDVREAAAYALRQIQPRQ